MDEKERLRRIMLEKLMSLSKEERERRSIDVIRLLENLWIYQKAKIIMGYYPLKNEVDVLGLIRKAFRDKIFCFPVVSEDSKDMEAYTVEDLEGDFIKGPYHVKQPDVKRAKKVSIENIDLIIVPGLAFDRDKNRLGRGGGFYDLFLKRKQSSTPSIGVGFDFQIVSSLPINHAQDTKVDFVVSENEVF